ncbi:MAG: AmmeMemoRadiSam system radical SAM enzyme [Desulfatibacillaceae bacterium]
MKEAALYEKRDDNKVKCHLCNHRCSIKPGKRGICGVRENVDGTLNTLVYARTIARNVDPIEKKPLFHFLPGTLSYSIATVGCNFKCRFCQNADIAQMPADQNGKIWGQDFPPEQVVADAAARDCASIAYTYTEPTIYFEYAYDCAVLARERGIKNVFVTNGYMTPEAIERIQPYLDAANVDLKAMNDRLYKELCQAKREAVMESLKLLRQAGVMVEVTTLIVPGWNDDPEELKQLAGFLAESLGPDTPWHVSRFHPTYRLMDAPATPVATLLEAYKVGREAGLQYVYAGNIPGQGGEDTICPGCGETVIMRHGFSVRKNNLDKGKCGSCGESIHGVWE